MGQGPLEWQYVNRPLQFKTKRPQPRSLLRKDIIDLRRDVIYTSKWNLLKPNNDSIQKNDSFPLRILWVKLFAWLLMNNYRYFEVGLTREYWHTLKQQKDAQTDYAPNVARP